MAGRCWNQENPPTTPRPHKKKRGTNNNLYGTRWLKQLPRKSRLRPEKKSFPRLHQQLARGDAQVSAVQKPRLIPRSRGVVPTLGVRLSSSPLFQGLSPLFQEVFWRLYSFFVSGGFQHVPLFPGVDSFSMFSTYLNN